MGNPVLDRAVDSRNWLGTGEQYTKLQYSDVIVKTAVTFGITVVSAAAAWLLVPTNSLIGLVLALGAFGAVMWGIFKPGPAPTLLYAVLMGGAAGIISRSYAVSYGEGLVGTALMATAVTFGVCLIVYRLPGVRRSGLGRRMFMVLLISFLVLSVVSLLLGVFTGLGGGLGFYGLGAIGIVVAVAALALSAWGLVIDFGDIEAAVDAEAPESVSWTLVLGLTVSIIWVYLNILRLLALSKR